LCFISFLPILTRRPFFFKWARLNKALHLPSPLAQRSKSVSGRGGGDLQSVGVGAVSSQRLAMMSDARLAIKVYFSCFVARFEPGMVSEQYETKKNKSLCPNGAYCT
jgi:hypothetical protein